MRSRAPRCGSGSTTGASAREDVARVTDEEMAKLGPGYEQARELFDQVATGEDFVEFLTLPAYELLG